MRWTLGSLRQSALDGPRRARASGRSGGDKQPITPIETKLEYVQLIAW